MESYRQFEYIKLFEKNPELGIFLLFHVFMNFGTTGKSFNVLLEALKKMNDNNSFNTQVNQNQFSSLISELFGSQKQFK